MEIIEQRNNLIKEYSDFANDLFRNVQLKQEKEWQRAAIIDARYTQLKTLEKQIHGSLDKVDRIKYVAQNQPPKTQEEVVVLKEQWNRTLQELKSEYKELQDFKIDDIVRLANALTTQRTTLQTNLQIIQNALTLLEERDAEITKEFDATTEYLQNRNDENLLNTMREQNANFTNLRIQLSDFVKQNQVSLISKYQQQLSALDGWIARSKKLVSLLDVMKTMHAKQIEELNKLIASLQSIQKQQTQATKRVIPKVTDQPVVRIFEIYPPKFDIVGQSYKKIQQDVFQVMRMFQWPPMTSPNESNCFSNELNPAQRISYHYMQPFNTDANVTLVHSVGAGKTATLRLITSLFVRAGYDVMLTSPIKLKDDLLDTAYKNAADFNVQQYTHGTRPKDAILEDMMVEMTTMKTKEELVDLLQTVSFSDISSLKNALIKQLPPKLNKPKPLSDDEKDEMLKNNIKLYLFDILKKMGMRQYQNIEQSLTYQQLSNVAKPPGGTKRMLHLVEDFFLKNNANGEIRRTHNDILYKVFSGIDEAHNLVAKNTNLKDIEIPDFLALRNMLWNSYRQKMQDPNYLSARVALLTATPVANHPLDAINLATLLYIPDESLGFNNYGDIKDDNNRKKLEDEFMQKEFDPQTQKFKREDAIKQLFAGRFSYCNMVGDARNFAQPYLMLHGRVVHDVIKNPVQYIPVRLSMMQMGLVGNCFRRTLGDKIKVDPKIGNVIQQKTGGIFLYDDKTQTLNIMKLKGISAGGTEKKEGKKTFSELSQCLLANVTWPWITQGTSKKQSENFTPAQILEMPNDLLKTLIDDGTIRDQYSPLFDALIKTIARKQDEGFRSLYDYYRKIDEQEDRGIVKPRDPEKDLKNYKQFVFFDTLNDKLGTKLLGKFLEAEGYEVANQGDELLPETASTKPYKRFLLLDNSVKEPAKLIDAFNKPDNTDGRNIYLAIANGKYKEGISLFGIRYITIAGMITTDASLKQAVARGIRNCSRKLTPFTPGTGWTVDITIISPAFPTTKGELGLYPLELIEMLQPAKLVIEVAKNEMMRLIKESAYDKELLRTVNTASDVSENLVKLWADRKK